MYPHHFKGEGQFVAKFQDKRVPEQTRIKEGKSNLNKEQKQLWEDFAKKHLKTRLDGLLQVFGDNLYLLPKGLPDLSKVKIARMDCILVSLRKNGLNQVLLLELR